MHRGRRIGAPLGAACAPTIESMTTRSTALAAAHRRRRACATRSLRRYAAGVPVAPGRGRASLSAATVATLGGRWCCPGPQGARAGGRRGAEPRRSGAGGRGTSPARVQWLQRAGSETARPSAAAGRADVARPGAARVRRATSAAPERLPGDRDGPLDAVRCDAPGRSTPTTDISVGRPPYAWLRRDLGDLRWRRRRVRACRRGRCVDSRRPPRRSSRRLLGGGRADRAASSVVVADRERGSTVTTRSSSGATRGRSSRPGSSSTHAGPDAARRRGRRRHGRRWTTRRSSVQQRSSTPCPSGADRR